MKICRFWFCNFTSSNRYCSALLNPWIKRSFMLLICDSQLKKLQWLNRAKTITWIIRRETQLTIGSNDKWFLLYILTQLLSNFSIVCIIIHHTTQCIGLVVPIHCSRHEDTINFVLLQWYKITGTFFPAPKPLLKWSQLSGAKQND